RPLPHPCLALPPWRQRLPQHAGALRRFVLLLASPDDRDSAGRSAADWLRWLGQGARAASAGPPPAPELQPRPARHLPAHRVSQPEPLALSGHGHLVVGKHHRAAEPGLARTLPRYAARAG